MSSKLIEDSTQNRAPAKHKLKTEKRMKYFRKNFLTKKKKRKVSAFRWKGRKKLHRRKAGEAEEKWKWKKAVWKNKNKSFHLFLGRKSEKDFYNFLQRGRGSGRRENFFFPSENFFDLDGSPRFIPHPSSKEEKKLSRELWRFFIVCM